MKSQQQNTSIFFFALFSIVLIVTYKVSVWDPYFAGQQAGQPGAATSSTAAPANGGLSTSPQPIVSQGVAPGVDANGSLAASPSTTLGAPLPGVPSLEEIERHGVYKIETESLRVTVSRLGGRIIQWELLNYGQSVEHDPTVNQNATRFNLVDHVAGEPYPLGIYSGESSDARIQYDLVTIEGQPDTEAQTLSFRIAPEGNRTFVIRGSDAQGVTYEKRLTIPGRGYRVGVQVSASDQRPLAVELNQHVRVVKSMFHDTSANSGFAWFDGNSVTRDHFFEKGGLPQKLGATHWAAVTDLYFSFAAISVAEPLPMSATRRGADIESDADYALRVHGQTQVNFQLFGGPNSYRLLANDPQKLDLLINFGMLRFLCIPLLNLLNVFFDLFRNYGLAIVALTILVKMLTLPLTSASFRSMKAMQDVQPEVKRIKEGGLDAREQQAQLMELYKKKGINPLGGCLPILIQLPIFIGLYTTLSLALELRHAPFALWINDLSEPEKLVVGGVGLPVMVLLLVLSMLIQQLATPTTMDAAQRRIMLIMPIVMGFLFMGFPAGLTLYWLVSNIIAIGQMSALRTGSRNSYVVTSVVSVVTFGIAYLLTLI